jgi:putative intracellular protease/amidase
MMKTSYQRNANPRILMLLTSHATLGETGEATGLWLEEFAAPYFVFSDAGVDITLASPKGGQPPIDPKSALPQWQTADTHRFEADAFARAQFAHTLRIDQVDADDYDALFVPGGHGPMWDYPDNAALAALVTDFDRHNKPIAAVCHGPAALLAAIQSGGRPLVAGRRLTAFTNTEEAAVGLSDVVPFLLESRLHALGARIVVAPDFAPHVVVDRNLITGQNPASSAPAAHAVIEHLGLRVAA